MENSIYEKLLSDVGLTKEQSLVYEMLLKTGFTPASRLSTGTGIKRSLVYKILDQLISLGLTEKREDIGKVALFFPAHPSKLKELISQKEESLKTATLSLGGALGQLTSAFNLLSGKPNIQFFEGEDGVRKVLKDSLSSSEIIDAYSDIESIEKYIPEINTEYVAKRRKFGVKKRGLILDTPKARQLLEGYNPDITENKFMKCSMVPPQTQTILQIYDNKVSFISLGENLFTGTIIENPHIYFLQKYLYQCLWEASGKDLPRDL